MATKHNLEWSACCRFFFYKGGLDAQAKTSVKSSRTQKSGMAVCVPRPCLVPFSFRPNSQTASNTRVGKKSFYTHFVPPHHHVMLKKHFHQTQVCILPFSNIERGNGGVDTYSVDITIIISCFWHFPTQFVQGCR